MTITLTREEAQQVLDAIVLSMPMFAGHNKQHAAAIETLRARLAQPEPEPVAVWELQEGGWDTIADPEWMESLPIGTKLYTAPPQREWQGLTADEIKDLHYRIKVKGMGAFSTEDIYRVVEAKLKEKNT